MNEVTKNELWWSEIATWHSSPATLIVERYCKETRAICSENYSLSVQHWSKGLKFLELQVSVAGSAQEWLVTGFYGWKCKTLHPVLSVLRQFLPLNNSRLVLDFTVWNGNYALKSVYLSRLHLGRFSENECFQRHAVALTLITLAHSSYLYLRRSI